MSVNFGYWWTWPDRSQSRCGHSGHFISSIRYPRGHITTLYLLYQLLRHCIEPVFRFYPLERHISGHFIQFLPLRMCHEGLLYHVFYPIGLNKGYFVEHTVCYRALCHDLVSRGHHKGHLITFILP